MLTHSRFHIACPKGRAPLETPRAPPAQHPAPKSAGRLPLAGVASMRHSARVAVLREAHLRRADSTLVGGAASRPGGRRVAGFRKQVGGSRWRHCAETVWSLTVSCEGDSRCPSSVDMRAGGDRGQWRAIGRAHARVELAADWSVASDLRALVEGGDSRPRLRACRRTVCADRWPIVGKRA